jgi:hypothetical protein
VGTYGKFEEGDVVLKQSTVVGGVIDDSFDRESTNPCFLGFDFGSDEVSSRQTNLVGSIVHTAFPLVQSSVCVDPERSDENRVEMSILVALHLRAVSSRDNPALIND